MPRVYTFGMIAAVAIAWIGAMVHRSGHAPIGLVSIGIGAALGATLVTIAAKLRVDGRRKVLAATLVLTLFVILAQHAWLYASFRREWRKVREDSPHVAMFRDEAPWSPREYIVREATPKRVVLWCIDAAMITMAAVGTVLVIGRYAGLDSASQSTPTPRIADT
jgi:hypothetical protein